MQVKENSIYHYVFIDDDLTEQTIASMHFNNCAAAIAYLKILAIGIFEDSCTAVYDSSIFGGYYKSSKTGKCLLLK